MSFYKQGKIIKPKVLVSDCDGVLSTHHFYYTTEGKIMKKYSADDNDVLSFIKPYLTDIVFVTGDKRGFDITKKRVEDMKCKIDLVSTIKRLDWIKERYNPEEVIYIGDGILDGLVFQGVGYAITTNDAFTYVKQFADYITSKNGGDRCFAEACLHLMKKFFKVFDYEYIGENEDTNKYRDWTV